MTKKETIEGLKKYLGDQYPGNISHRLKKDFRVPEMAAVLKAMKVLDKVGIGNLEYAISVLIAYGEERIGERILRGRKRVIR